MTALVFGPLELYLHNAGEFWFSISSVAGWMAVIFLVVITVLIGLALILRGRARCVYICVLFGVGLALYLQRNWLNAGTSLLDGRAVDWLVDPGRVVVNTAIWLACLAVPAAVCFLAPKAWQSVVCIGSVMVIGVQLASVVFLGITAVPGGSNEVQLTREGMFDLSREKNIIVFVTDTMDAQYFEQYVMDEPEYAESLRDFTYFDNAVSGGGPTMYGLPLLLTGMYYTGEDYDVYLEKAYESATLYPKLEENGYDVRIYTDDQFVSDGFYTRYVANAESLELVPSSRLGLLMRLYQFTGYEYAPVALKNGLYLYSGVFDEYKAVASDAADPYILDDAAFIRDYRTAGLTAEKDEPVFRFYHLNGAHGPYHLDENGQHSDDTTGLDQQIHGVMNAIFEYVQEMKELGLYDSSTIVISADHGTFDVYQNPMLLIKPAGVSQQKMRVTSAPITFQNVPPTLSEAVDGRHDEGERTVFEVGENEDIVRYQVATYALVNQFYGYNATQLPHRFQVGSSARDAAALVDLGELEALRDTEPYELGRRVDFTEGAAGNGSQYLFEGFSGTDVGGTWTVDTQAIQRFTFAREPERDLLVQVELNMIFPRSQFVTVYFNDTCVFSRLLSETEFSFVVPRSAVADGSQQIRYELSTGVPSAYSSANDDRTLALRFAAMTISETEQAPEAVEPVNRYQWGEEIVFVPENDGRRYFSAGIDVIETDCVWSVGTEGQMRLLVDEPAGDITAEMRFERVFSPPQRLTVKCQGQVIYEESLDQGENAVQFTIPADCVQDGRLVLDLAYPDAATPRSLGENDDERILAFRFASIRFSEGGDRI